MLDPKSSLNLNNNGFTLVELMAVIGIVALLSSVAIPNYQRMTARSRQAEAKIALANIYVAEKGASGEIGSYTGCLKEAGYMPEGTTRYYATGFGLGAVAGGGCGPAGTSTCNTYTSSGAICQVDEIWFQDPPGGCSGIGGEPLPCSNAYSATVSQQSTDDTHLPWDGNFNGGNPLVTMTSVVSQNSFVAGAAGVIRKGSSASDLTNWDIWQIDDQKRLINKHSGL